MANTDIIPPRVDFIDARTGKISRPWFNFLLNFFQSSESGFDDLLVSIVANASPYGLTPNPFIGTEPRFVPHNFNVLESGLSQLRQELNDFRSLVETAPISRDSGSTNSGEVDCAEVVACLDAGIISAFGYWSPLTNGDPVSPELIFDAEGDTISVWTPL